MEEDFSVDGYNIKDSELSILLSLRPISTLTPHEETVQSDLDQIVKNLRRDPYLRHPIIADNQTGLVLDGNHRLAALSLLKCRQAPCALVNYQDPRITVERWFRNFGGSSLEDFRTKLSGITTRNEEERVAETCLSDRTCYASLEDGKSCIVFPSPNTEPVKLFRKSFEIEKLARNSGLAVSYSDNKTLPRHPSSFVHSTIRLRKQEIIDSSLKKILFPPKSTRHIIPSRPLGISIPLTWLKAEEGRESQARFKQHLRSKKVRKFPRGSKIGSRTYQEEVFVFE